METKPTNKQKTNKNKTKNKKSPQNQFFVKSILEHFQNTCFDTLKINNYYIIILKKNFTLISIRWEYNMPFLYPTNVWFL